MPGGGGDTEGMPHAPNQGKANMHAVGRDRESAALRINTGVQSLVITADCLPCSAMPCLSSDLCWWIEVICRGTGPYWGVGCSFAGELSGFLFSFFKN